MNNKRLRYFWGFNKAHQNWLNKMSASGYRLVKTGKLTYEFENCKPFEYQYYVSYKTKCRIKFIRDDDFISRYIFY